MSNELRPTMLGELVGQKDAISTLEIMIASANARSDVLPHLLLNGPAGLGKTTISQAIANEMNANIQIANGGSVTSVEKLTPYILRVKQGDVLFIDEIHRISKSASEFLYPVMEDFRVDIGTKKKSFSKSIPKFTLIGATTEAGSLERPMYDRFQSIELKPYSIKELSELVLINAKKLNLSPTRDALVQIAARGRGTPRITNNLLLWVRDYCIAKNKPLDAASVAEAMDLKGIDKNGLTPNDRAYLDLVKRSKVPLGLNSILSMTGLDRPTVEDIIEPFLLRMGLVIKTSKGRQYAKGN